MRLRTKSLVLRDWERADIPALVEGLGDLRVSRWLASVPHPYTAEDAERWIDRCSAASREDPTGRRDFEFAIELRTNGKVIGGVGLTRIRREHGTAGGGLWIRAGYQGRGYGSEALAEKIRFAFEDVGLRRLENGFFEGNAPSRALQERFGYRVEGRKRRAYRCMADGELRDEWITGLLREEWRKG